MYEAVPTAMPVGVRSFTPAPATVGDDARRDDGGGRRWIPGRGLREAEVEHLEMIAVGDEEVRRLDVAVNDAAPVRGVERIGDLAREVEHAMAANRSVFDQLPDGAPFEPLHRDERLALVLAELVDRADVRVLQRGGQTRLALEPRQPLRRRAGLVAQHLDRDFAAEPEILRSIHHAHAAFAQAVQEGGSGRRRKVP